jgi:SAM-dependent methyltransferase
MIGSSNHFDSIADRYDKSLPEHVQAHYRRKRVRLIGPLLKGGEGLDVGCGTGLLMEALKPYGRLVGVDGSPGMVEILKKNDRGDALVGPTYELPFADGRFDVVFCVAVLHHVADPMRVRATIREMVRVARPGGHVVIWDHNPKNPYWPSLMARVPQDSGEERLIPDEEMLEALRSSGVREIRLLKSGFVPEFVPPWLTPLAKLGEVVLEHLPVVRRYAAHNVVIGRKGTAF